MLWGKQPEVLRIHLTDIVRYATLIRSFSNEAFPSCPFVLKEFLY